MGRNRKWVLEDNLQEAVWRTIMRGPRPPSVRWEKRNLSAASSNTTQKHLKQPNVESSEATGQSRFLFIQTRSWPQPGAELQSSRQCWPRWERMTRHLPRSKPHFGRQRPKPRNVRCQSRSRTFSCLLLRSRSESRRLARTPFRPGRHWRKQEALLTGGEKRLAGLQEKEKTMQSPFIVPEPMVVPHVQAEFSRMQEMIDGLQKELAILRGAQLPCSILVEEDEDMAANLPYKKSKVVPQTPLALTFGAPKTPIAITGDRGLSSGDFSSCC